jgi:ABC-type multidrug transport system fused ATPase/permease subunit
MVKLKIKSKILSIFKEFFAKYPKHFVFLFVLLLIEGVVVSLSLLAVVPLADFLLDPSLEKASRVTSFVIWVFDNIGLQKTFTSFGLLFVFLNLFKGVLEVFIRYSILKIKYEVVRGLFKDVLTSFFKAKWGFFSSADNGQLLNTMNKELNTIGDTLGHLATLLAQIIQLCIYLAVPFWLNAKIAITAIGLSLLFGFPFLLLNRISYQLGKKNTETANKAMGILSEVLQAARLILGFGRQVQARDRYLTAFDDHVDVTLRSQTLSTAIPKFFQPLGMFAAVIAMGLAIKQSVPISELAAVMWSLLAAIPLLASLLQGNVTINNFLPSYEQLVSLREKAFDFVEIEGTRIFTSFQRSINFKDVVFTYSGRSQTLSCINLSIKKGQMTALIGHSGSGKSTMTDLLLGLQVPNEGAVLIDGISLSNFNQNSFRERIGYVPQDPMLFHSSIRENLLWSFKGATETDLWLALRLANAENFIKELPEGIDTIVGDRGVRLSGGQRQRIALARALIRKPELLILDEATSALDSESELLIQESIEMIGKDTTILIVAHRLSTIAKANKVYILDKGKIVEEGTFQELSNSKNSILNQMLAIQQAN